MFKAKIKADKFREVVDVISALVDEAKFNIKSDGISLRAVDPAHVAMLDMVLQKKAFEEYKAKECELGIDIDKLKDVLKLAGPSVQHYRLHRSHHKHLLKTKRSITILH